MKIYVVDGGAQEKRKDRMKLSLLTTKIGLVEKLRLGPTQLFPFIKISFPVKRLMPHYAKTDSFRPPNSLTLQTTLLP